MRSERIGSMQMSTSLAVQSRVVMGGVWVEISLILVNGASIAHELSVFPVVLLCL